MKYRYEAKTKEGETQVGFVEAGTRDAAVQILTGHELFVLRLEESERVHWYDRLGSYFTGVTRNDMVVLTRQLATLLEARIPLNNALRTLYEQTKNPTLKEGVRQIGTDIDAGLSFSQAIERQSEIFSDFFVSMIRTAEVAGTLDRVAGFLADYTEREAALVTKARSALIYPMIIILLFVVVAGVMVMVVFPQIQPVFEQSGVELPLLSRVLINSGVFVKDWWFMFLLSAAIVAAMVLDYLRTPEGQAFRDDLKVTLPVLNRVYLPLTITRFANAATMLIRGGVPVTQAIEIVGETVDNVRYRDVLHEVAEDVRQGKAFSEAIGNHPDYFPVLVSQMIAVGETTGRLDSILERVATFYGREADALINNLVDLIQPILMVVIGLFVGLLFASILLPLYRLTASIQ